MGAFDGVWTHDLHITSQMCNPLRQAAPQVNMGCSEMFIEAGLWSKQMSVRKAIYDINVTQVWRCDWMHP